MKIEKILGLGALACLLLVSCGETTEEETTEVVEEVVEEVVVIEKNYSADTSATVINYKGYEGEEFHSGIVKVTEGTVSTKSENGELAITAGSVTVDLNSITDNDGMVKLEGHLKSADFFNIVEFPTAEFKVTKHEEGQLYGTISLLGQELEVVAPVTVEEGEDMITVSAEEFRLDVTPINMPFFVEDIKQPVEEQHDRKLGISFTFVGK
jgi:polyisoprenoid-binding protein YceI